MTSLLTVKLRRDLRATWSRVLMMVVAIAVSLAVFGGVLYAWSVIDRETARAYAGTEPASATIQFAPAVDAEQMAAIVAGARSLPGVLAATGRTQFTSDIEVDGEPRDNPVQVFVAGPDDPMRMARFDIEEGAWPPSTGEVYLRRDTLDLLELAVGDTVTVETPGAQPARLRVADTVYDPSLAPAAQEQAGTGYLSTTSLAALGETEVLDQLKVQVADGPEQATPSRDRDAIVATASAIGEWLQREHGLSVREIQVPEPYQHPHERQADVLLLTLLAGAGAALLLSTILVANMLNGLFTQQIPQIGIMKAIGARSRRIGRLYLAMTLVIAGAATVLALAPGIWLGRALAPFVFGFLGIEAASLAAAWWTYPVVLAAGTVLPALLALIPLVRTSRTTVRAAIDYRGLPARGGGAAAWLGRIPRLDRGLLMALRNTTRRPARFWLSVGLLASAGAMFVAGMSTRDSTQAIADTSAENTQWDVVVQLRGETEVDMLTALVERVPGVSRVEGWTIVSAGITGPGQIPVSRTYPDQGHGRLSVTAIPADTAMLTLPRLREGRWPSPGEIGAVVLNQVTVAEADFDIDVGDTIELDIYPAATTWRVVGIAEEWGASGGVYTTAAGLAEALDRPGQANTLRIATEPPQPRTRAAVAAAVAEVLTDAGIEVRAAQTVDRTEAGTEGHLAPVLFILLATALPMGIIGCIGLASTMGANVLERIREFSVMHAIGARPSAVRRIVIAEGVFIALASCLLAVIPALGLTAAMNALLGKLFFYLPLPFAFSILAWGSWAAVITLGAILATEAAATRAARLTVREALAYL